MTHSKPTPADYKLIFEDHRIGKLIFEELEARFVQGAVTTGGIDAVLKTYVHLGQHAVILHIHQQIARANQPTDLLPQPEVTE